MAEIREIVYWPGNLKDLKDKSKNCIICLQACKNLKTMLPRTETRKLETAKLPLQELQIDFLGPLIDEKRKHVLP